jgi:GTP diphosphokinase / guanosine-3',5'-bis(diphosphate) 3'-diphosphatase
MKDTKTSDLKELIADPNLDILYKSLASSVSYVQDDQAIEKITEAYLFSKDKHKSQCRKSGEAYISHPVSVAMIVAEFKVDPDTIISALLHDVVEDTDTELFEIENKFGKKVSELVDGLTKISRIKFRSNQERMAENFRKMILAMAKDLQVILIKLADRLHNMRTLNHLSNEKRQRISQETLDIYAPLASRLGIYGMKSELEDLCLKEINNKIYKEITTNIAAKKKAREDYISEIKIALESELHKYNFKNARVYGRPKHFFSIYRKMRDRRLAFKDIHDLLGFRVLVDSIKECYEVLGVVHAMWKPMPGRFKDYIAMPKANLYQSLHTTVIRSNGNPAEIQIRTYDMHNVCEHGIAAHWSYKEKSNTNLADFERFSWLRQMMELQRELKDPNEFLAAVKVDLFDEEIFVFTPRGDVKQLSSGATALDFAFEIHTDVGITTVGAKVNGRIRPLRWELSSGDIVEIMTSHNQHPSKDWLSFLVTSKARSRVRSYLRSIGREKSKKIGYDLLVHELKKRKLDYKKILEEERISHNKLSESAYDDLLISIGYGKVSIRDVLKNIFVNSKCQEEEIEVKEESVPSSKKDGILVSGLDNILVYLSKCCNPLPGEEIVGFITRGRGVSIHRSACSLGLDLDPARKVDVVWNQDESTLGQHMTYLEVVTEERKGILAEVTSAISNCGVSIMKAQVKLSPQQMGFLEFEVLIKDVEQLNRVINAIRAVKNVVFIERKMRARKKKQHNKK